MALPFWPPAKSYFDDTPESLRRLVLFLYSTITPALCLAMAFLIGPDWLIPVAIVFGICAIAFLMTLIHQKPGPIDWIFSGGLVPILCSGIAAWVLGERGFVFFALLTVPLALAAVQFRFPTVITALISSTLVCFALGWRSLGLAQAILITLLFVLMQGLIAWLAYGKSSHYHKAQLDSLSRHINDIELTLNDAGEVITVNDRAVEAYGYSEAELVGMNIWQLRAPEERSLVAKQFQMAKTQEQIRFETVHCRSDGSVFPVEVSARHFSFRGNTFMHTLIRDTSERKKIEQELNRNRIQLDLIINGTGLGVWDWQMESGNLFINEEWAKIVGYTRDELEPISMETLSALTYPDDLELSNHLLTEYLTGQNQDYCLEARVRHKDGRWIWIQDRGKIAERSPEGKPLRMSGTREDISQRKEIEVQTSAMLKEILNQNDLKERLFTILAHDLRGPVGNLNALLGMVIDGYMSIEDLREALPTLKYAADSAYNLLENILQWVRSSMNEIIVLQERIDINSLLETIKKWLEPAAQTKSIELILEPTPLSIMADQRMAETILRNMVSNALKFSPQHSTILLKAENCLDTQEIRIDVVDHGPGIPADVLKGIKLREPAKRSLGSNGESGSGLGLLFSQDMAARMDSRIEIESTVGMGSRFSLVFNDVIDGELSSE